MYKYTEQKQNLFTDNGQRLFLSIRDATHRMIKQSGAVMSGQIMDKHTGDCWDMLACMDRMIELGEIREVTNDSVAGQHRVFVSCKDVPAPRDP